MFHILAILEEVKSHIVEEQEATLHSLAKNNLSILKTIRTLKKSQKLDVAYKKAKELYAGKYVWSEVSDAPYIYLVLICVKTLMEAGVTDDNILIAGFQGAAAGTNVGDVDNTQQSFIKFQLISPINSLNTSTTF